MYTSTIVASTAIVACITAIYTLAAHVSCVWVRKLLHAINSICIITAVMVVTVFYFYWIISGKEIRTDILLTVVQRL